MMNNKYIPVNQNGLYFIYVCSNEVLFPCSKRVHDAFLKDSLEESKNDFELSSFMDKIKNLSKDDKQLFSYKKISRNDLENSLSMVRQIILEITEQCNLHCLYCCYGDLYKKSVYNKKGNKEYILSYLYYLLTLRKSKKTNSPLRITFYGGEATLCFDIIKECVSVAKSMLPDVELSFGMTTNGMLLDKYIDYFVKNNFYITISLDGDKLNNSYRVTRENKESFPIVEHNINMIIKRFPKYFEEYISFNSVLHDRNNQLDVISYFSKWSKSPYMSNMLLSGAKDHCRQLLEKIGCPKPFSINDLNSFKTKFPDIEISNLLSIDKEPILTTQGSRIDLFSFNKVRYDEHYIYPGGTCYMFQNKVFVTIDGYLLPCEKISRKYKFGKISTKSIRFYTKNINSFYAEIQKKFKTKCLDCYRSYSCSKCFFSDVDDIENGTCFCDKTKAISEIY